MNWKHKNTTINYQVERSMLSELHQKHPILFYGLSSLYAYGIKTTSYIKEISSSVMQQKVMHFDYILFILCIFAL